MNESSNLPNGWTYSSIGSVCTQPQYGYTTKASDRGKLRLLRTTDISSGSIDWQQVPFCSEDPLDKEKYLLKDGDILISRAGSVGISYLMSNPGESVFASYLIRFNPFLNKKYFKLFLETPFYWDSITESQLGIAVPNVNASKLKEIIIPVAPEPEQLRIVAKIEELFSELDKGIESLKTAKVQLQVYRQSLLKHAFEGKLTEQWREDNQNELENADELLTRIQDEREARYQQQVAEWQESVKQWEENGKDGKKPKQPTAFSSFRSLDNEDVSGFSNLPKNWVYTRFENLIEYVTSGSRGWAKYYAESGAKFIRAQNLKYDRLDLSDIAYVSLPDSVEGRRTLINDKDLLITITGANVTKTAYVNGDIGEAYVSQHVALTRLINTDMAQYVHWYLIASTEGRHQLERSAYGAGKPGLNLDNIKDVIIPISSVSECKAIAQQLSEKLSVIDEQVLEIDIALKKSEALRQSILKKAFSGQLVSQDPNDEPASELLKRIAVEKVELEAQAKQAKAATRKPRKKTTAA